MQDMARFMPLKKCGVARDFCTDFTSDQGRKLFPKSEEIFSSAEHLFDTIGHTRLLVWKAAVCL